MKALEILEDMLSRIDDQSSLYEDIEKAICELQTLQANYESQEIIIADLRKELNTANKQVEYWKLSFRKQCEASRR